MSLPPLLPVALGDRVLTAYTLVMFSQTGTLATGAGIGEMPLPFPGRIAGAIARVHTAPAGAAIEVDINLNPFDGGGSIYLNQANRPTIAAGQKKSQSLVLPGVHDFAANDYLTLDLDRVGSPGTEGSLLTVTVVLLF